jgi:hypothetical protein
LLHLAGDPAASMAQIVNLLRTDPVLTMGLLRVANSPLFAARQEITDVRQAVTYLQAGRACAFRESEREEAASSRPGLDMLPGGSLHHVLAVDPVQNSICGLTRLVHESYRSELVGIEEMGGGLRRIRLRLTDDMAEAKGTQAKPTVMCSVIAPRLDQYYAYRRELWSRIEHGGPLDIC